MASLRVPLVCSLLSAAVACGGGGGFPDAKVIDGPPAGGHFSLAWTVSDAKGATVSCDKVGGASVSITFHDPKVAGGGAEAFTCQTLMGMSEAIAVGTYDMAISLVASNGIVLQQMPVQHNVVIMSNQTTPLPAVAFTVDATGNLKLKFDALQSAGNCAPKAGSGAGITSTTITLVHSDDSTCAPVTFEVSAGSAGTAATYTVDCTTPVAAGCFEADQEFDALGIDSGGYQIHVTGNVGSAACWTNNDTLKVPSTGRDLDTKLNLGATGGSGC